MELQKVKRASAGGDLRVAVILFFLTLLLRGPFLSSLLYHWDSVQFALGMMRYDVSAHQPHPPGYILYVFMGRLVDSLVGEANLSLVMISLLFSAMFTVMIYFLGERIYSRGVGLTAAVMVLFSPAVWFHGEVALTYIVEAFLVTLIAWLAYGLDAGDRRRLTWMTLTLGVTAGIRQNTGLFLLPLWLCSVWCVAGRGIRRFLPEIAGQASLLGVTVSAWAVPMIRLSGGLAGYMGAVNFAIEYGGIRGLSVLAGGLPALLRNLGLQREYLFYSLHVGGIGGLAALALWLLRERRFGANTLFYTLWIAPSVLFYSFLHINRPGHIFTYMPAVLLICAAGLKKTSDLMPGRKMILIMLTAYCLAGSCLFFRGPQETSLASLKRHEAELAAGIGLIRSSTAPADTLILAREGYRHAQYYLGNFKVVPAFGITGDSFLREGWKAAPPGIRNIILFDRELLRDYAALHPMEADGEGHIPFILRKKADLSDVKELLP